jgi:putative flippase GtrA
VRIPFGSGGLGGLARLIRFGLTGCAGFVVDFGLLWLLKGGLGAPLALATTTAYVVGGVVHYSLTRFWVFPQEDSTGEGGRIIRYLALAAVNIVVTLVLVLGLSHAGLDYRVAKVIAVVALFFSNYFLTPRVVMTSPGSRTTAPRSSTATR